MGSTSVDDASADASHRRSIDGAANAAAAVDNTVNLSASASTATLRSVSLLEPSVPVVAHAANLHAPPLQLTSIRSSVAVPVVVSSRLPSYLVSDVQQPRPRCLQPERAQVQAVGPVHQTAAAGGVVQAAQCAWSVLR